MPTRPRPSIRLYFLGAAPRLVRRGGVVVSAADVEPWLRRMDELNIIADVSGTFIPSAGPIVGLPDWAQLCQVLDREYQRYDGYLVVQQPETLPAAAHSLTLMLDRLGKPVVVTSAFAAHAPGKDLQQQTSGATELTESGARANLINAAQVATANVGEVVVVSGSHLYRGSTLAGTWPKVTGMTIGKIDFGIRFFGQEHARSSQKLKLRTAYETNIRVVDYVVGMDLLPGWRSDHLPRAVFLTATEQADLTLPVQQLRQHLGPRVIIAIFAPGVRVAPAGALVLDGPSRSAAFIRLSWALGQTKTLTRLKQLLQP